MIQPFKRLVFILSFLSLFSVTNAQDWQFLGLQDYSIFSIAVHPEHSDTIFAASLAGLFMSPNGGLTWDTLLTNRSVWNIAIHPENPQIMYVADNLIEKTIDGGQNWFPADSGIYLIEDGMFSISIDPQFPDTLFAGSVGYMGGKLYKTVNGGGYWESISDTIDQLYESISTIAINPQNTQTVFVGTGGLGFVMRTTDGGVTWDSTGLQLDIAYDIEIDNRNPNTVYAGGLTGGFYKSENSGVNWTAYNDGLNLPVAIRAIEIGHTTNQLFFASIDNVYQSQMSPIHWNEFNTGLPGQNLTVRTMVLDSINSMLYLGTNQGIYVNNLVSKLDNADSEQPDRFILYHNYPNPFNPTTTISYWLAVSSEIELTIYSLSGQRIRNLVSTKQAAGAYRVQWDGRNSSGQQVASGVYIYRLQAGKFREMRKMLLLR